MAREWQQTKQKEYVLPDAVYYQCLWAVRDLKRMEDRLKEMERVQVDEKKSGSLVREPDNLGVLWKPTEVHAMEKVILEERIKAIYSAMSIVPEIYRPYILNDITKKKYRREAPNKFWKIWKQRFLFTVAKNLSII